LIANTRDSIKAQLSAKLEYQKPGAIPVHACVLYRFVNEMELGDIVVYPSKSGRLVNDGRALQQDVAEISNTFAIETNSCCRSLSTRSRLQKLNLGVLSLLCR
jgi:predicted Mrr-cat superfamily restriction endonuclease